MNIPILKMDTLSNILNIKQENEPNINILPPEITEDLFRNVTAHLDGALPAETKNLTIYLASSIVAVCYLLTSIVCCRCYFTHVKKSSDDPDEFKAEMLPSVTVVIEDSSEEEDSEEESEDEENFDIDKEEEVENIEIDTMPEKRADAIRHKIEKSLENISENSVKVAKESKHIRKAHRMNNSAQKNFSKKGNEPPEKRARLVNSAETSLVFASENLEKSKKLSEIPLINPKCQIPETSELLQSNLSTENSDLASSQICNTTDESHKLNHDHGRKLSTLNDVKPHETQTSSIINEVQMNQRNHIPEQNSSDQVLKCSNKTENCHEQKIDVKCSQRIETNSDEKSKTNQTNHTLHSSSAKPKEHHHHHRKSKKSSKENPPPPKPRKEIGENLNGIPDNRIIGNESKKKYKQSDV